MQHPLSHYVYSFMLKVINSSSARIVRSIQKTTGTDHEAKLAEARQKRDQAIQDFKEACK